jgi:hypothetical protein
MDPKSEDENPKTLDSQWRYPSRATKQSPSQDEANFTYIDTIYGTGGVLYQY